jgi:hypothetical protein
MVNQIENPAKQFIPEKDDHASGKGLPATGSVQWLTDVPGPTGRWWLGIVVAAIFAIPLAWLLSYAASLPFFLGLFFFMLFGLIIGAIAFRVSARGRPYAMFPLILGTTFLVALVWSFSLVKEARDFPGDVARRVSLRTRDIGDRSLAEFRGAVAEDVRSFLASRYGPVQVWSYIRWVLTNGELKRGDLSILDKGVTMPAAQTKAWWAFRVVASAALLGFGISSQTLSLRAPAKKEIVEPGQSM